MISIKELVFASQNPGKLQEIQALLPSSLKIYSASVYGKEEPQETKETFQGNAILKAEYWFKKTGLPSLADDSGICIEALQGAPGVHSKEMFIQAESPAILFHHLSQYPEIQSNPRATFVCILALYIPSPLKGEPISKLYKGECEGKLTFPARGSQGHGYDPIFQPLGSTQTFAEMTPQEKNTYSHRAKAFELLKKDLNR